MHRFFLSALVLAALALPALAGQVPIPRQKPKTPGSAPISTIPIPRQKPAPPQAVPPPAPPPVGETEWPKADIEAERAECSRLLGGLDMTWTWASPLGGPGGCGAAAPITVTAVAGATLSPPGTFRCGMAAALHKWMATSVQPAARRALKQPVSAIGNASSYVCRHRNGLAGGKVSEHGKANALDIASFTVGGESLSIAADMNGLLSAIGLSPRAEFLKQVRKEACASFTTVLGPGSDPYHGDHFHVDALQRKNGFRICQ